MERVRSSKRTENGQFTVEELIERLVEQFPENSFFHVEGPWIVDDLLDSTFSLGHMCSEREIPTVCVISRYSKCTGCGTHVPEEIKPKANLLIKTLV